MPKFDTPQPITANIEPGNGYITVVAGDRGDTVVDIRPTNPDNESDVDTAQRTTVDFSGDTLTIRGPKLNPFSWSNKTRSIDVTVELPAGSHVDGKTAMGDLTATGRLGDVSYKTGLGHIRFDEAATLSVTSATGNVLGNRVTGKATITTASGRLQAGELAGGGVLNNSNGVTVVGAAGGPLKVRSANGDITVEAAADDVDAKTANGAVRVLDAQRGSLTLETAMGEIEVGIHDGSAAWLDVRTKFGLVRNEMTASSEPAEHADKVEIHASTAFGDVTVRRA
jgi:Putative adhesin